MGALEELQSLANEIAAAEPEQIALPPEPKDDSVRTVAHGQRNISPFAKLCVSAADCLERLIDARILPNELPQFVPEQVFLSDFIAACKRLLGKEEPHGELPSQVLARALMAFGSVAHAPADPSPLVDAARISELASFTDSAAGLAPIGALCQELNLVWAAQGSYSAVLLLQNLASSAASALGYAGFAELCERHPGGSAYKTSMKRLELALDELAAIPFGGESSALEIRSRFDIREELDALLAELIRMTA